MVDFDTAKFKDIPVMSNEELINPYTQLGCITLSEEEFFINIENDINNFLKNIIIEVSLEGITDILAKLKQTLITILDKIVYYFNKIILSINNVFLLVYDALDKLKERLIGTPYSIKYWDEAPINYKSKFPNLLIFNNNIDNAIDYILKNIPIHLTEYLNNFKNKQSLPMLKDRENNSFIYCIDGIPYKYNTTLESYLLKDVSILQNKINKNEVIRTIDSIKKYNSNNDKYLKLGYELKKYTKDIIDNLKNKKYNKEELENMISYYKTTGITIPFNLFKMYSNLSKEMTNYIKTITIYTPDKNHHVWNRSIY